MLFRLTVVLAMVIFAVMYLAPSGPTPDSGRDPAARQTPPAQALSPADPAPGPAGDASAAATLAAPAPAAPAPPARDTQTPSEDALAAALAEALDATDAAEDNASARPLAIEGAGELSLGTDGVGALSLADRVRARAAEQAGDAQRDLTRPTLETPVETITLPADQGLAATDTGSFAASPQAAAPAPAPEDVQAATGLLATPAAPSLQPAPGGVGDVIAEVTGTSVNLRAGPSTAESVVGRVNAGDVVVVRTLAAKVPGWTAIAHPSRGDTVYMSSRFLRPLGN